ncbi:MAG TPA: M48 family metalloprotease [bacterium]|nr:M48 family metalloprotease [bacterium]
MKNMKKTIGFAALMLALMVMGTLVMAQFKMPDLKDLDKAKGLIETGKKVADASKPWTYPEERATGEVLAAQVASSFGGVWRGNKSADAWTAYVNKIGRGLVPYGNRPDIKYRFAILNSDDINAYSCPGGYIFVTRGLLKSLNNEAQLAGVLAHEIAHASERHIEKAIKNQKVMSAVLEGGVNFAQAQGKLDGNQATLAKNLGNAGFDILTKTGLSQADEFEADKVGTETIYRMGYTAAGISSYMKRLRDAEGTKGSQMKYILATHPSPDARVTKLKQLMDKQGMDVNRPNLADRYQAMVSSNPVP